MDRNTLLDFLTQRTDRETTREFHRVLAADENRNLLEKLMKTPDAPLKDLELDPKQLKGLEKLIKQAEQKGTGEGKFNWKKFVDPSHKDILDFTPGELDQLFKVFRDDSERIDVEVLLLPEYLSAKGKSVEDIKSLVSGFYNEHKALFDSPKDLEYDVDDKVLTYKGDEKLFEKLLVETLKVKSETFNSIMEQKKKRIISVEIPFQPNPKVSLDEHYFGEWEDKFKTFENVQQAINELVEKKRLNGFEWGELPDKRPVLKFKGYEKSLWNVIEDLFFDNKDDKDLAIAELRRKLPIFKKA